MKADTITKDYVRNANIFADIFNYYIYNGEQVILPDQLSEKDPTKIAILYSSDGVAVPVQKFRDVQKLYSVKTDGHFEYVLCGAENQTETHYAMPVRNNLYDALDYFDQVQIVAREHKKHHEKTKETQMSARTDGNHRKHNSGEFLSGFWKEDKLIPSITLTIYFGEDEWDGPLSLFEMMGMTDPRVLSCMDDYHVRLISPARMSDEDIMKFQSSLREVMFFIKYSKNLKDLESVIGTNNGRFKDLERRAADVITAVTGAKFNFEDGKERVDMCQALRELRDEGKAEGIVQGRSEGIAQGRTEGIAQGRTEGFAKGRTEGGLQKAQEIARNLSSMGLRVEQIAQAVGCAVETAREWLGLPPECKV